MSRLPFDPARVVVPQPRADSAMSVSDLANAIKGALQAGLPRRVRVVGEVSNFGGGTHWFFSLKDEASTLRCVLFARGARLVNFTMSDGAQVLVTGRVDFYDKQGNIQIYVDDIEPVGRGRLEAELQRLMAELRELGYFAPDRKRPLPTMPRRIAVVTSRKAAALQDVIDTARRRWRGCQLLLCDVRVQGDAAAGEIAAMIRRLSTDGRRLGIDAILITRGGGSIEDLWAFNERVVADAVYECELPTVAAIGHETDTTVAELVADARYATPTQAVMGLVPEHGAMMHQVDAIESRLRLLIQRRASHLRQRVEAVANHRLFRRPGQMIDQRRAVVDALDRRLRRGLVRLVPSGRDRLVRVERRLASAITGLHSRRRAGLEGLARALAAVNPRNVLDRGYTFTLGGDGRPMRSASDATRGETLTTVFHDGEVRSVVSGSDSDSGIPPKPRRRSSKQKDVASPTLFGSGLGESSGSPD